MMTGTGVKVDLGYIASVCAAILKTEIQAAIPLVTTEVSLELGETLLVKLLFWMQVGMCVFHGTMCTLAILAEICFHYYYATPLPFHTYSPAAACCFVFNS